MSYAIDCGCGKKLPVNAVDAGGIVLCQCGATVSVPALSILRQQAGQSSYPVNVADKLLAMHQAGELPVEQVCARCGIGTSNVLPCALVCETAFVKRPGWFATLAMWFVSPFTAMSQANAADHIEVHGRDVSVPTPLRLCVDCESLVRTKQKQVRLLLQNSAIYGELLAVYPFAGVELDPS